MEIKSLNPKKFKSLITPELLNELLNNKQNSLNIKLFDCTYPSDRGYNLFKTVRIANANFFDFDFFRSDQIIKSSQLSLGFPNLKQIENFVKKYEIKNSDQIILYDQYGIHSSPRAWFLLNSYNIKNISILNGGLPLWMKNKFPINTEYYEEEENESEESEELEEGNKGIFVFFCIFL